MATDTSTAVRASRRSRGPAGRVDSRNVRRPSVRSPTRLTRTLLAFGLPAEVAEPIVRWTITRIREPGRERQQIPDSTGKTFAHGEVRDLTGIAGEAPPLS